MRTIHFITYDKNPKQKDKNRKSKKEIDIAIDKIMALTTAKALTPTPGGGKWPLLYVDDFSEPLELPDQSFDKIKDKLIAASRSEYQNVNKFICVGAKVLVNYDRVYQINKLSKEIIFWDNRTLDDLDVEMLTEYERLAAIEHEKACYNNQEGTRLYLEGIKQKFVDQEYKRSNKFARRFIKIPVNDKLVVIGFLILINIVLSFILIIMIGILLYHL